MSTDSNLVVHMDSQYAWPDLDSLIMEGRLSFLVREDNVQPAHVALFKDARPEPLVYFRQDIPPLNSGDDGHTVVFSVKLSALRAAIGAFDVSVNMPIGRSDPNPLDNG